MTDYWAPPVAVMAPTAPVAPPASRRKDDLTAFGGIVVASVLLGAPAGLLWSVIAPHYTVHYGADGAMLDDLESTKAFVGADGTYLLVMLGVGLLCGALTWLLGRRAGPYAVAGLVLGGVLGALISASVGVRPGSDEALEALRVTNRTSGTADLPLVTKFSGRQLTEKDLGIRSPWAAVGWPVAALGVFLIGGFSRPEELD